MLRMNFTQEKDGIYRLRVPFENLYTSVFLIITNQGNALVDCATTDSDVDEIIFPALKALKLTFKDIAYLILTHNHGDHAGGLKRVLEYNPNIEVVQKVCDLSLDGITLCALKGHTLDCIGVLDMRTNTLISGDGLQGAGVGKYRCFLESKEEYVKTIERLQNDERIENILFSHEYEPWYQAVAVGREQVKKVLHDCKKYI